MYKLIFTQEFEQKNEGAYMALERRFMQFERDNPLAPKGRRFTPYLSGKPQNTLIWECEFDTLEQAIAAKRMLEDDETHTELLEEQIRYFVRSYAEIYRSVD